jgi:hypothetical protein
MDDSSISLDDTVDEEVEQNVIIDTSSMQQQDTLSPKAPRDRQEEIVPKNEVLNYFSIPSDEEELIASLKNLKDEIAERTKRKYTRKGITTTAASSGDDCLKWQEVMKYLEEIERVTPTKDRATLPLSKKVKDWSVKHLQFNISVGADCNFRSSETEASTQERKAVQQQLINWIEQTKEIAADQTRYFLVRVDKKWDSNKERTFASIPSKFQQKPEWEVLRWRLDAMKNWLGCGSKSQIAKAQVIKKNYPNFKFELQNIVRKQDWKTLGAEEAFGDRDKFIKEHGLRLIKVVRKVVETAQESDQGSE